MSIIFINILSIYLVGKDSFWSKNANIAVDTGWRVSGVSLYCVVPNVNIEEQV